MKGQLRKRLLVHSLEDRTAPAAFTVLNLNDSGADSLRDCVTKANAAVGPDTITFKAGLAGFITLISGQLAPTGPLTIQGPGKSAIGTSLIRAAPRTYEARVRASSALPSMPTSPRVRL